MDNSTSEMKICTKCGQELPATLDYFSRHKTGKGGLRSHCKACGVSLSREYALANPERTKGSQQQYYQANKEQIQEYKHQWHQQNKQRISEKSEQYRQENKERLGEQNKDYYQENRDKILEYHREYYEQNKQSILSYQKRYYENNDNHIKVRVRKYRKDNWDKILPKVRINTRNRRARKRGLPDTLTIEQWQAALDYFNGCCAVCGRQLRDLLGKHTAHADHWIPLNYKGTDNPGTVATNIVPLCGGQGGCNESKSDNLPDKWLVAKYGKRKANEILQRIETYFEWVRQQNE